MDGKVVLITGANTGIGGAFSLSERLREFRHVDSDHYHCNIHIHDHHKKCQTLDAHFSGLETAKDLYQRGAEVHLLCRFQHGQCKTLPLSGQEQACSRITRSVGYFVITLQKKY